VEEPASEDAIAAEAIAEPTSVPEPKADTAATDAVEATLEADAGPAAEDVVWVEDVVGVEATEPADLPAKPEATDPFSDCGGLGIGPKWGGSFLGLVSYDLDPPPGLGLDQDPGTLLVSGSLGFEIACLEGKLIVKGEMSGEATAEGTFDTYPFTAQLQGSYAPSTGHLKATMSDGMVKILQFVEVYFEGQIEGDLQPDGTFKGTWGGEHAGNNFNLQGIAHGSGTWQASAQP
jgi:hypothetical protein